MLLAGMLEGCGAARAASTGGSGPEGSALWWLAGDWG